MVTMLEDSSTLSCIGVRWKLMASKKKRKKIKENTNTVGRSVETKIHMVFNLVGS